MRELQSEPFSIPNISALRPLARDLLHSPGMDSPHAELIFDDYVASTFGVESSQIPSPYLSPLGGLGSRGGLQHPRQLDVPVTALNPSTNGDGRGSARQLLPLQHSRHTTASPRAPEEP
jgi:hypothetical protein